MLYFGVNHNSDCSHCINISELVIVSLFKQRVDDKPRTIPYHWDLNSKCAICFGPFGQMLNVLY